MKTPIAYYGGKQNMLCHILPNIPKHTIYTEAFFGGGAVFFAKEPSESEIINDNHHMVVNFYQVVQSDFENLKLKIEATLFSRATYAVAWSMYRMPHLFSPLQLAWAFYVGTNMGFACHIGSWGFDKYGKRSKSFINKKLAFDHSIVDRLESVTVECSDACEVIERFDTPDAFHYIDPPYVGTELGHYKGYTEVDYKRLLDTLVNLQGKFLLSGFPNDLLERYVQEQGWLLKSYDKLKTAVKAQLGTSRSARKTEVLVANYPIE